MDLIRKKYLPDFNFKPSIVSKALSDVKGLYKWNIELNMYDKVKKIEASKKEKLEIPRRYENV